MKFVKIISEFSMFRILIAAVLMSVGYFFLYYDNGATYIEQISKLNAEVNIEEAKKKDTEKTIKREDEMRANLASLARDLQVVKAKLPNEFTDAEMTALINKASSRSGVALNSLSRKKSTPAANSNVVGADSVEEIIFDLSISGHFNQFLRFLDAISKEEKTVRVRDFTIDRNGSIADQSLIRFKGDIIGFKQAQQVTK